MSLETRTGYVIECDTCKDHGPLEDIRLSDSTQSAVNYIRSRLPIGWTAKNRFPDGLGRIVEDYCPKCSEKRKK